MRFRVLIYSVDSNFLDAINMYINSMHHREFNLVACTQEDKAVDYIKKSSNNIDILIANPKFITSITDKSLIKISISDRTDYRSDNGYYSLNIYQTGDGIVTDLRKICIEATGIDNLQFSQRKAKIISFFSSQGGSGKTTIAYLMAIYCAKDNKVLYVNLEQTPFLEHYSGSRYPIEMSEILFATKDRRSSLETLIKGTVKNKHNIYTLPPFKSMGDLLSMTVEDITMLLKNILDIGEYEYIVFDLSSEFNEINHAIMQESNKVVLIYSGDALGNGKLDRMLNDPYISRLDVFERFRIIRNKCQQKTHYENCIAAFPFSQSMAKGIDVSKILYNNLEFEKGCKAILEIIG